MPASKLSRKTATEGADGSEAVASYLKDMEPPQREPKHTWPISIAWSLFTNNCAKKYIQDVKREDVLAFIRKLYELSCGPRTAYNRAVIVSQLLKANGITKLLHNRDWPEYVEPSVRCTDEEIQALLKACDADERVLYLSYLLTGLRDKEMRYLTWRDIDFRTQVIRVTRKPLYGFKPKNKEEREVPVPDSLIAAIKNTKRQGSQARTAWSFRTNRSARQAARIQTQAHRLPRETELRTVRVKAREQVLGRAVLLQLLPSQIPTYVCDAEPARSRLRHQDPAELDGPQRSRFNDGLFESGSEQGCNGARELQ